MNLVILMGRLCADPDIGTTGSGKKYARYRLAVDRPGKSADGQQTTDFLPCITWEKGADFAERHLVKGKQILVQGRIQTGSYEKNGEKRYTTDIVVERHEFCGSKSQDAGAASQPGGYGGGFTGGDGVYHPYPPPESNPYLNDYVDRLNSDGTPVSDFAKIEGEDDQLPF